MRRQPLEQVVSIIELPEEFDEERLILLDEALSRLLDHRPEIGELVRLRYFAGLRQHGSCLTTQADCRQGDGGTRLLRLPGFMNTKRSLVPCQLIDIQTKLLTLDVRAWQSMSPIEGAGGGVRIAASHCQTRL